MTKVVNLRTARKQRARQQARKKGDEAAARSGESRTEKITRLAETDRAKRHLDGHARDRDEPET
ncbi:DUF4169 family protein [Amaricoccus macauensis]|uniref:DUF4169 family protein n=1 Tax=Amaricoccus macauensis TaxID=57001 RepID=UPI003C7ECA07